MIQPYSSDISTVLTKPISAYFTLALALASKHFKHGRLLANIFRTV